ncbi:hypothetical protein PAXRUDRAFT_15198 [Paxillus rubicundulus Ve08.2h10]|uniref:Unplaced genomic scaffold scaffold_961, whole genome shotgun sequence n=1 Tax=Paxillus rubicundulus Ve08.2h10 TaxID=930991 RepID=A0A0D0D0L8_9AGAM|nr:hypothetical protein PAXRUDRAFT_15198 [Paxillus rubicundulus Ve08.2h10]
MPDFLKSARLIKILKVALFGKASLSGVHAPGPKTKGQIWELCSTSAGMVAAAAVMAIFSLSGDLNFYQVGNKTSIPYYQYHNYYCQQLLSGNPWSKSVFTFFNDTLFPATSSVVDAPKVPDSVDDDVDWEANFERAFEAGHPLNTVSAQPMPSYTTVLALAPSISSARPDLTPPAVKAKPSSKSKHKGKAKATTTDPDKAQPNNSVGEPGFNSTSTR